MTRLLLATILIIVFGLVALFFWWPVPPQRDSSQSLARVSLEFTVSPDLASSTTSSGFLSWLGVRGPSSLRRPDVGSTFTNITSTGFASSPYQTDATPCRTASGAIVRPGTVASNFLPLGTLLKITVDGQELPGTFIVEDRMADRFSSRIDIWFAQTSQALDFGKRRVEIIVIGHGQPGQSLAEEDSAAAEIAVASEAGAWEAIKLRARSIADFLATRGIDVNRFDVDCLKLQQAELNL